jgi:arabinofuranosyltransferase
MKGTAADGPVHRLASLRGTRPRLLLLIGLLVAMAWNARWLQDDAYITFVYARNLVAGWGPVWNPGYAVEGYTNFLWMVLLAGAHYVGLAPPVASEILSLACFAGSLLLVFSFGRLLFRDDRWALLAVALLGTNYSFLKYATGGLETQLNATLTLGTLLIVARAWTDGRVTSLAAMSVSACSALAVMTRPDSTLLAMVAFAFMGAAIVRARLTTTRRVQLAVLLLVPFLLIIAPWLAWKYVYYGHILPNTFLVKLGIYRPKTALRGLVYVVWPFVSYGWLPVFAFIVWRRRGRIRPQEPAFYLLLAYTSMWLAYIVDVGGDIMEFRQLICVFPIIILLMVAGFRAMSLAPGAIVALSVFVVCASGLHAMFFPVYVRPRGIENIPELSEYATWWCKLGTRLREDLGEESEVTVAVSPAGAIPYCSGLRAIDVLGLNDLWVARNGYVRQDCDVCLGHLRMATIDYLNRAGANLVFGHPQELGREDPRLPMDVFKGMLWGAPLGYEDAPLDAQLLSIPVEPGRTAMAVYLQHNARIDDLIARNVWSAWPLRSGSAVGSGDTARPLR